MTDYPDIRKALRAGELDDFLDEIGELLLDRRRTMIARHIPHPGDIIIISRSCKPKMLAGAHVIFRGMAQSRLKVELQQTYSPKWTKGKTIRIPATLVGEVIARA
jgi:hypothetical protein